MAPLISFPIDLSRTASALESVCIHLSRIGDALERLAPAPLKLNDGIYQAKLSDLRRTDVDTVGQIKSELQVFANNSNTAIDSDLFIAAVIKYENEVAEAYGENAINELPWNKAAGGPLFRTERQPDESSFAQKQSNSRPDQSQK